uniref:CSON009721 protein n=1 Tax=Culicoides sonorensis TaxID=179676 RepID=A0A336K3D0_CULSO
MASCVICLSNFTDEANQQILLNCHHSVHRECLVLWKESAQDQCPLCSEKIVNIENAIPKFKIEFNTTDSYQNMSLPKKELENKPNLEVCRAVKGYVKKLKEVESLLTDKKLEIINLHHLMDEIRENNEVMKRLVETKNAENREMEKNIEELVAKNLTLNTGFFEFRGVYDSIMNEILMKIVGLKIMMTNAMRDGPNKLPLSVIANKIMFAVTEIEHMITLDCPQCRRKVNPKQIYRVILSFETSNSLKLDECHSEIKESNNLLIKSLKSKITDLEQQFKSKEYEKMIIDEKENEIQLLRSQLKTINGSKKLDNSIDELTEQLKCKDAVINQSLMEVKEIEQMLLDLERASRAELKQNEIKISELSLKLNAKDQTLNDLESKSKLSENKYQKEIQRLKDKLKEACSEIQFLQSKLTQISSVIDDFKIEQVFKNFKTEDIPKSVTVDDLLQI